MNRPHEIFVGEELVPQGDRQSGPAGQPLLPRTFSWRGREYHVAEVLSTWKESGPCSSGGGEKYLRKHWYHLRLTDGEEMKVYFERQARSGSSQKHRWWIYTRIEK